VGNNATYFQDELQISSLLLCLNASRYQITESEKSHTVILALQCGLTYEPLFDQAVDILSEMPKIAAILPDVQYILEFSKNSLKYRSDKVV
jgi:hypothetical protein